MFTKVTVDFETRSRANLKQVGAYEYSMCKSTIASCFCVKEHGQKPMLLRFAHMQQPWEKIPERFRIQWLKWIAGPYLFSAHNAFFEQCIYKNVLVKRFGWPVVPPEKWRCTAAKAAALAIPRNLAGAGAVMNLRVQKDYEGHRIMLKLCKPTSRFVAWQKNYDKYLSRGQHDLIEQLMEDKPDEFWSPDTAPEDYLKQDKYCVDDVLTEELLDDALPDLNEFEQKLWYLDQKINFRGVAVDMAAVKKISAIMAAESKTMNRELDVLTMGLVSSGNARNQILDFLELEGIELPDLKAKTVDDFLKEGKVTGDAKKLLEIRRALSKASTAKYKKFLGCAASDGRVRDLFLYHGASTGRWGGKNVQPQNCPRGVIKDIEEAIEHIKNESVDDLKLLYGANLMPLFSSVLRGMFVATKGKTLFVEDLSAIELRVLWWLAGHKKGLDLIRTGQDPYKHRAASIFGKLVIQIADDGDERQTGKAAELGCGYQMGWKKFITAAWDVYRVRVGAELAKKAVQSYREDNWPVVDLWDIYNNCAIFATENPGKVYRGGRCRFFVKNSFLFIELPSGRRLAYKDPSVYLGTTWVMTNDDTEDTIYCTTVKDAQECLDLGYKKKSEFQSKRLKYFAINHKAKKADCEIPKWARETTYGGKLAENITQAVARDVLAEAIIVAEEKGFDVLMHSHDEMVSEAEHEKFTIAIDKKGKQYCPEYREILETPPHWAPDLPLKASGWSGPRYKKG